MHIDVLEKKWSQLALGGIGVLVLMILFSAVFQGMHAPSHVETIDSAKLHLSEEFAEDNLGLSIDDQGRYWVRMVAGRYNFFPGFIEVPAQTQITFRWVSMDVLHGVHIPMTNMSTMIVPGYVAEVTTVFPHAGEYPVLCNEYCGMGHDYMWSNIRVVPKHEWQAKHPEQGAQS